MAIQITHAALYDGNPFDGGDEVERVELAEPMMIGFGEKAGNDIKVQFSAAPKNIADGYVAFIKRGKVIFVYNGRTFIPAGTNFEFSGGLFIDSRN